MTSKKKTTRRFKKLNHDEIKIADPKLLEQIKLDDTGLFVPEDLNPHRFQAQWMAVCYTCDINLSPRWRDIKAEADNDRAPHLHFNHWTDIVPRFRN